MSHLQLKTLYSKIYSLKLHPALLQTQTKFSNYMKIIKSKTQHKQKINLQII